MKKPIRVDQREELNEDGESYFWYTVRGGNGENTTTSKMYRERSKAKRAARAFITAIDPAPVVFTYWTGLTPATLSTWYQPSPTARRTVSERIR